MAMEFNPIVSPIERIDVGANLRRLLVDAIDRSGRRRAEIAAEMTETLGRPVTKGMIDDLTRSSTRGRDLKFPGAWLPAFCQATGPSELRLFLLGPEQRAALELGQRLLSMSWALNNLQALVANLTGQSHREKPKRKRRKKGGR